jgi:ubiquinone/menaquinone biosynthesis C-methylase UbiE
MSASDSKQAEKDYLRRSRGGDWEASKPFPPPGHVGGDGHAQDLLDFAVLMRVLAPEPADPILDLGAGSGWVSDWLRRFGFKTVAVDIAWDMLRLGADRLRSSQGLVAGDMEHLPFRNGAFNKACCLNAFHHVPNMPAALVEIRRVLSDTGVVFFSEPGVGHASHPTSLAAVRNYGVQEKEILIQEFMAACKTAGFADVRLHPISNIVPLFALNQNEWLQWRGFTASKRPFRALNKMYRAVLEFAGVGKQDVLFEEAFAIRLLRELQPIIESHPVITAHCRPFVKPGRSTETAQYELLRAPASGRTGESLALLLRVTNAGTTAWNVVHDREVRIGAQLLDVNGEMIQRDYGRFDLPAVRPGGRIEMPLTIPAPAEPGDYAIRLDLVREGVHWFENLGSQPVSCRIAVRR